jgi:hypothetical protein
MPLFGSVAYQNRGKATRPGKVGTPSIVSQASGQVGISWTPPSFGGGAPIFDYDIEYSSDDGSTWTTWSHAPTVTASAIVTGLTDYQTYLFRVSAVNAVGKGQNSDNSPGAVQSNSATGGTTTTVSNYNGTGQTWRVHQFTSSGTLDISNAIHSFRVLWIGAGGQGGYAQTSWVGGGGAGGFVENNNFSITAGSHSITVGTGFTRLYGKGLQGLNGNSTQAFDVTAYGGGGGGSGRFDQTEQDGLPGASGGGGGSHAQGASHGQGGAAIHGDQGFPGFRSNVHGGGGGGASGTGTSSTQPNQGGAGGPGKASNITGISQTYSTGGGSSQGQDVRAPSGQGFPGQQHGCVIVAYRIA